MRLASILCFSALLLLSTSSLFARNQVRTIDDYNHALPYWGVTWSPGQNSVSRYYPSFYTGFAVRSQFPERIHIRTARGNQTRVTVTLDTQTVSDYLFDLVKRYEVYKKFSTPPREGQRPLLRIEDDTNKALPQMQFFFEIIESPEYDILAFVERARAGRESAEAIYAKGLSVMQALNPGRVFNLKINLAQEFLKWKSDVQELLNGNQASSVFTKTSSETVVALNSLLWGRINATEKPSDEVLAQLVRTANLAVNNSDDQAFVDSALQLFKMLAGSKYNFEVLKGDQFAKSLECTGLNNCSLTYSEFTTVYPTGSAKDFTSDKFGNRISVFYTPGLWQFLAYSGRDFDNIRKEPYYAWAPKMDFEGIGNGFHNPAVTFWGISRSTKESLGSPQEHSALGAVKRGGVSHGCLRLPIGHLWEMRQILPVENSNATQVHFFGNSSHDFDVYDVDGDGDLEVMGVEYMISYSVQGASGLSSREGDELEMDHDEKLKFYNNLYGKKNVFTVDANNQYFFQNPSASLPSYLDFKRKSVKAKVEFSGTYPLYEQSYEREKVQFYVPISTSGLLEFSQFSLSKRIVRLMGRVRGCAPSSDKVQCGEVAFDKEAEEIWNMAY